MPAKNQDPVVCNERLIAASPRKIFSAFENADVLARWWGPKDFTNTNSVCEFKSGGRWSYVMHGPNGTDYANECVFREIQPDSKIVIEHVSHPNFTLTIELEPRGDKTHLAWIQDFGNVELAAKLRPMCEPANEQNLDKLEAILKV